MGRRCWWVYTEESSFRYSMNMIFLLLFDINCSDFWLEFYIQDEICGWREDLFTSRKSAVNLLGVISMSKVTWWKFTQLCPLVITVVHVVINFCRGHQWRLPLTVYQPNVKRVKRTKEATSAVLWGSYWCFLFCLNFPFLLIPTCLSKKS